MAVFFNGRKLVTPTTASAVNDDAMQNQNLTVGNTVCIIGKSSGGQPKKALAFNSPEHARSILVSGELLEAIQKAFDPSAETPAPGTVYGMRVDPASQATLALANVNSTTVITLASVNYGARENNIKVKLENGTVSGKRITVQRNASTYVGDNIGRDAFSVLYSGAEATATITVLGDKVKLFAPAATEVAEILFSQFATVGDVVDRINAVTGFSASVLQDSANFPTLNSLNGLSAADCKTAAKTVNADLQAIVDWFNTGGNPFVRATRASGVSGSPVNIAFTYMTGGSDGTVSNTDWSDCFTELQKVDVQWVSPLSDSSAIHAMADTHVAFCSTVLGKERRAICGTASATSDANAILAAKAINSDRTSLVHLGHYEYNASGVLALRPPYMTAALVAAMFAGVSPGTPLTNKTMKVRGLERELLRPTETDPLIEGGILCVENTEQGYKVVQSISTWLGNDKYNRVEQSTGVAVDFTVRNVRQAVDILRGQKGNPLLLSRAVSITQGVLKELARPEPQGPGVLAGDELSPPYRNIRATLEGDVTRIEFECSPVIPNNYVLVTVYAVPYSGSAAA